MDCDCLKIPAYHRSYWRYTDVLRSEMKCTPTLAPERDEFGLQLPLLQARVSRKDVKHPCQPCSYSEALLSTESK